MEITCVDYVSPGPSIPTIPYSHKTEESDFLRGTCNYLVQARVTMLCYCFCPSFHTDGSRSRDFGNCDIKRHWEMVIVHMCLQSTAAADIVTHGTHTGTWYLFLALAQRNFPPPPSVSAAAVVMIRSIKNNYELNQSQTTPEWAGDCKISISVTIRPLLARR